MTSSPPPGSPPSGVSAHAQTLSRGIRALELLGESPEPMTIAEVAESLGVHRSVAYRILRTLEDHGLVGRDAAGRMRLGPGISALARSVSHDLQQTAQPELARIADRFGATAFVAVLDRREMITLLSVEPHDAHASIAQRPGTRHPVGQGAPGVAVQLVLDDEARAELEASGAPFDGDRIDEARRRGYATSRDEVIAGLNAIAVPLTIPGDPMRASLAVVSISEFDDPEAVADALTASATRIARAVG